MNQEADLQGRQAKRLSHQPPHSMGFVDVLIVGAGLSGIAAAHHLQQHCPDKHFLILERMSSFGGTWLSHNYPGIRSDSDLHTFGYRFKPWRGVPIATAEEIRRYMAEVIEEQGIEPHIHYHHDIRHASWSGKTKRWQLEVFDLSAGKSYTIETGFLWMCSGYYRHRSGYQPQWPGMDRFKGRHVHAETWPDDLDYKDQRVVVIGSGAAAATMIPAMAKEASHVTMLQRSPTFFITGRNINELVQMLRELDIPADWIHEIARRKILKDQAVFRTMPQRARSRSRGAPCGRARPIRRWLRCRKTFFPRLPALATADCLYPGWRSLCRHAREKSIGAHRSHRFIHR